MPKLKVDGWNEHPGSINPVSGESDGPFAEVVLGDHVGLRQMGARLERLPPGSRSSHRHWHETEDELLYVIEGEAVLVEDEETVLRAGDVAAWVAGKPIAHCLENRSGSAVTYLWLARVHQKESFITPTTTSSFTTMVRPRRSALRGRMGPTSSCRGDNDCVRRRRTRAPPGARGAT